MQSPDKFLSGNYVLSFQQIYTPFYMLSNKAYLILSYDGSSIYNISSTIIANEKSLYPYQLPIGS